MDVTVAVLTYRRNAALEVLLPLLVSQAAALSGNGTAAEVLVVDNDAGGGARTVVAAQPDVRYVVEPSPGIAAARNRALDESLGSAALAFIDDDELPEPGWLAALVETQRRTGAAAVAGPVESVFDGDLHPWIVAGGFFRRVHSRGLRTDDLVPAAATNNLLLDLRAVRRHGLRFDAGLGFSGGEDTLFTGALVGVGERIVWCREAAVVDHVPAARMTRAFVLRRVFAQSNASVRVRLRLRAGRGQRFVARARFALSGTARCLLGAGQTVAGTLARVDRWQARGCAALARGLGTMAGVLGIEYQEYRREHPGGH